MESKETEDFLIESQNDLYRELDDDTRRTKPEKVGPREFNAWNSSTRPVIRQLCRKMCESSAMGPAITEKYIKILSWMIQKACVIDQFDEVVTEHRLYEYIAGLLKQGYCVCGWQDEYPAGSLVVY